MCHGRSCGHFEEFAGLAVLVIQLSLQKFRNCLFEHNLNRPPNSICKQIITKVIAYDYGRITTGGTLISHSIFADVATEQGRYISQKEINFYRLDCHGKTVKIAVNLVSINVCAASNVSINQFPSTVSHIHPPHHYVTRNF